jgi:hypothetical protein
MFTTCQQQSLLFLFLFCFLCFCSVSSVSPLSFRIKHGDLIRDKEGEVLVSDGFNFVMGFFGFQNSSSRYVGIWYYNIPDSQPIWVANRNKPINGNGGSFTISTNGNLVILDENKNQIWSTNVSITHNNKNNSEAFLRDDGNLVLSNEKVVLWFFLNKSMHLLYFEWERKNIPIMILGEFLFALFISIRAFSLLKVQSQFTT